MRAQVVLLGLISRFAVVGTSVQAQTTTGPALRDLGAVVASSSRTFEGVLNVRGLSDGRVLVNDGVARQVWLLDSSLGNPRVVIDSSAGTPNSYLDPYGALFTAIGDTTLFFEHRSGTLLVLSPRGELTRVMAMPTNEPLPGVIRISPSGSCGG